MAPTPPQPCQAPHIPKFCHGTLLQEAFLAHPATPQLLTQTSAVLTDSPEVSAGETQPCQKPQSSEVGLGVPLGYRTALRQQDQRRGSVWSP